MKDKIRRCLDCPDCHVSRINTPQGYCTKLAKGLYAGVRMIDRNCPRDDTISAEMRLIVDGGCHPDCQHMSHCVRCGPSCKVVYDKLIRADAVLKLKVNGAPAITAIKEDGLLNFCSSECLQAYFSKLVENRKVE